MARDLFVNPSGVTGFINYKSKEVKSDEIEDCFTFCFIDGSSRRIVRGLYVDDRTITTRVKTKLVAEKATNLTRVDVDTTNRVVSLNGIDILTCGLTGHRRVTRAKHSRRATGYAGQRRKRSKK